MSKEPLPCRMFRQVHCQVARDQLIYLHADLFSSQAFYYLLTSLLTSLLNTPKYYRRVVMRILKVQ